MASDSPSDSNDGDHDWPVDDASGVSDESVGEELSLEDLGAAYARAAAAHDPENFAAMVEDDDSAEEDSSAAGPQRGAERLDDAEDEITTPEMIIEGVLFVGHPDNEPISEERLAKLIRGMTPEEVCQIIETLNDSYREHEQALRIVRDDLGFKMTIAPEVEQVRREFLGKVREARLNQSAIEVLSLVAYQPGITAQKVQDQRGRESNSLLNQLVRRQLIRIERKEPAEGGRKVPHYYPTERFLFLFGIESLDELPRVEEGLREG